MIISFDSKTTTKKATKFLLRHPDKWHSFARDYDTVDVICACVNLGIAKLNDCGQFKLKSKEAAERYVA